MLAAGGPAIVIRRRTTGRTIAAALAACMLAGSSSLPAIAQPPAPGAAQATAQPVAAPPQSDDVAATERSVVRVVTVATVNGEVVGFGHGSGFAITPTRIVTNAHVVGDAAEYPDNVVIGIVPSEGAKSYAGRLVRLDRKRDLAIVEIVDGRVPPTAIYTGPVPQRQTVYALGYPGNVDVATAQSMDDFIRPRSPVASDGIISSIDSISGVAALVHDADIARGSSGGPLVDRCGRVLGVNTYISRADDGDSPFGFAVTVRELAQFLQDSGQRFTAVIGDCITAAEASERDAAQDSAAARAQSEAEARAAAGRTAAQNRALEQARSAAQERRETFMALAVFLFGIGILAGAAALMYTGQAKPREQRAATLAAIILALGALVVFLLRPDPDDVAVPAPAPARVAAAPVATGRYGALSCQVDRSRGRMTISTGDDTALDITPTGCVNGRTQYSAAGDGRWTRTLVPTQDSTVSRTSYDPRTGDYVVRRYLLPLATLETLRRARVPANGRGCTTDAAALAALADREAALGAQLPTQPNEQIVSRCTAAAR